MVSKKNSCTIVKKGHVFVYSCFKIIQAYRQCRKYSAHTQCTRRLKKEEQCQSYYKSKK